MSWKKLPFLFVKFLIRVYQLFLRPIIKLVAGPYAGCRYHPSCSHYFIQACECHGVVVGSYLGVKRILRCNPWGGCGEDHVPPKK